MEVGFRTFIDAEKGYQKGIPYFLCYSLILLRYISN